MVNETFDQVDDFDIEFGGIATMRVLRDGVFHVAVKDIAKKKVPPTAKKHANCDVIEWTFVIKSGELNGIRFIASSFLNPESLKWTTDRIIASIFPAISAGQKITPLELIGGELEVAITTRKNEKTGQTSMYVQIQEARPWVPEGVGSTSAVGSSDIPY